MSSCCLNQFNENASPLHSRLLERFEAIRPSEKTLKSFVELVLIATAIITLALV